MKVLLLNIARARGAYAIEDQLPGLPFEAWLPGWMKEEENGTFTITAFATEKEDRKPLCSNLSAFLVAKLREDKRLRDPPINKIRGREETLAESYERLFGDS